MGEPLVASGTASSDYFEPEDPAFNEALQTAVLPGDAQGSQPEPEVHADRTWGQPTLKRSHSMVEESDASLSTNHVIPLLEERHDLSDEDEETYGASSFGGYGQYMRRKRAKLQIQNVQMDDSGDKLPDKSRIFRGIAIYVRS
jgi:DNA repair protein REV1